MDLTTDHKTVRYSHSGNVVLGRTVCDRPKKVISNFRFSAVNGLNSGAISSVSEV